MPGTARKTVRSRIPFAIMLALLLVVSGTLYAWATTETVTYSYDDTYQLTGASYDGRAVDVAYAFDDSVMSCAKPLPSRHPKIST